MKQYKTNQVTRRKKFACFQCVSLSQSAPRYTPLQLVNHFQAIHSPKPEYFPVVVLPKTSSSSGQHSVTGKSYCISVCQNKKCSVKLIVCFA